MNIKQLNADDSDYDHVDKAGLRAYDRLCQMADRLSLASENDDYEEISQLMDELGDMITIEERDDAPDQHFIDIDESYPKSNVKIVCRLHILKTTTDGKITSLCIKRLDQKGEIIPITIGNCDQKRKLIDLLNLLEWDY